ncbi:serine/threonine-protein kinase AFC1-like, partial [Olea europaea var. sylvestris]|uniref:serine/threonine-protein kinase AFC1-like n=1 Tax=Olea europaea var. sylvestris TaxID=158386 RepID=UPI000C1CF922
ILPTIYQGKEINSSLYVNLKYLRVFLGSASSDRILSKMLQGLLGKSLNVWPMKRKRLLQLYEIVCKYRTGLTIVFEKLGPSLYDFLHKNSYLSFPIDLVREFDRQFFESVAFMHDLHLIHTDLKPENILLVFTDYIKVLDYK